MHGFQHIPLAHFENSSDRCKPCTLLSSTAPRGISKKYTATSYLWSALPKPVRNFWSKRVKGRESAARPQLLIVRSWWGPWQAFMKQGQCSLCIEFKHCQIHSPSSNWQKYMHHHPVEDLTVSMLIKKWIANIVLLKIQLGSSKHSWHMTLSKTEMKRYRRVVMCLVVSPKEEFGVQTTVMLPEVLPGWKFYLSKYNSLNYFVTLSPHFAFQVS